MLFSKSFGYALRGILYVALAQSEGRRVQVDEISEKLGVPRHFLGKILNRMVKEGLLQSVKGPYGGFALAAATLQTPLLKLIELTDGLGTFNNCVLRLHACNAVNPCPLHHQVMDIKNNLQHMMMGTLVSDLMIGDREAFIRSIATEELDGLLQKITNHDEHDA
ncbi:MULTISPECIES: RrF2 family transcriptional regulator [Chitinophagaceae]|uniref:RrF2 family transcriptional regulator n=1 Tax=Chitinophagaceae TaxID=563835 RepID=UPI000DEFE0E6|nr:MULTISPECIES: Rrf2 family transcriptional regulator [Chitinophagaceae]RPD46556.1 Rrf2 family transcriptional regulator [Paracnuella aquatica]